MFIPDIIKVGYQERSDTYSGKLSYVIYYDEKKKLRKEPSWEGWRDKSIDPDEFNNEPTEGFVLNKKAGGDCWGWNPRQTYVRVYDPRGFEIEITVPNLLYILDNATSTKGKGLEGELVYGWDGKDLMLIPVDSPDYDKFSIISKHMINNISIKPKDLIIGREYLTKYNDSVVFMGRDEVSKEYIFFEREHSRFSSKKSVSKFIINEISDDVSDFLKILDYKDIKFSTLRSERYYLTEDDILKCFTDPELYSWGIKTDKDKNNRNYNNFSFSDGKIKEHYWNKNDNDYTIKEFKDKLDPYVIMKYTPSGILADINFIHSDFDNFEEINNKYNTL